MRREQPSDAQVRLGAQPFRYQRIRGLLNTVVDELVRMLQALDQFQTNGVPEIQTNVLARFPQNDRKHRDLGGVAEAGELLQRRRGLDRQAGQSSDHEVHHVVGVPLGVNAIELPAPARRVMIEAEQPLVGQREKELDREERIAAGLLLDQLSQGPCAPRFAVERIGDEPANIVELEGRQHYLAHPHIGIADRSESPQKRVGGSDLVVPIRPDQKQVLNLRMRDQVLDEIERRGIQPLQIVEEQRERMFLAREHAQEAPENHLEAVLRVLWWQIWNRRLFPDHKLEFRNEIDDQLTIWTERLEQAVPPPAERLLVLGEERADQGLERLAQGKVWDAALVLVELAGREQATRRHQHLVQFIDHRGLTNTGISGHQHKLQGAGRYHPIEGSDQRIDLALPAVELLRDQQPVRYVATAEREGFDPAMRLT